MTDTELLDAIGSFPGKFRLSNKAGAGYWWCYLTVDQDAIVEIARQGNTPREALKAAFAAYKGK